MGINELVSGIVEISEEGLRVNRRRGIITKDETASPSIDNTINEAAHDNTALEKEDSSNVYNKPVPSQQPAPPPYNKFGLEKNLTPALINPEERRLLRHLPRATYMANQWLQSKDWAGFTRIAKWMTDGRELRWDPLKTRESRRQRMVSHYFSGNKVTQPHYITLLNRVNYGLKGTISGNRTTEAKPRYDPAKRTATLKKTVVRTRMLRIAQEMAEKSSHKKVRRGNSGNSGNANYNSRRGRVYSLGKDYYSDAA